MGPDPDSDKHILVKIGNSVKSIPKTQLHATHEAAEKDTGQRPNSQGDITKHPQYTKADHDYLTSKGWSNAEIAKRWDEEKKRGEPPQQVNKRNPPSVTG